MARHGANCASHCRLDRLCATAWHDIAGHCGNKIRASVRVAVCRVRLTYFAAEIDDSCSFKRRLRLCATLGLLSCQCTQRHTGWPKSEPSSLAHVFKTRLIYDQHKLINNATNFTDFSKQKSRE